VDFVVELVVQLFAQVLIDLVGEYLVGRLFPRTTRVLQSRAVQYVVSIVAAIAFGFAWGQHLSGSPHRPKLLWVSLGLAVAATLLALRRPRRRLPYDDDRRWLRSWRTLLAPPWRWSRHRLIGFALVSVWIAIGIALGYQSRHH
jgi:hypothetical protein